MNSHGSFILTHFDISLNDENKCLSSIYWRPKLHKSSTKTRSIIAARKCSIKPLSKSINSVYKLMFKQIESYYKQVSFFSRVKLFWSIHNNQPVIDNIKN